MTNPNLTEIVCILDRSGSMRRKTEDVIGGFNTFLAEQRELEGDARMTLVLFDDNYEMVYDGLPLSEVPELSAMMYRPRGSTALLDAVGRTIDLVGMRLAMESEERRPGKVLVLTMTDGEENCSRDYWPTKVKDMVQHQQSVYQWEFVFIGAGIDAFAVGETLGYAAGSTVSVPNNSRGIATGNSVMSQSVTNYRTTGSVGDLDPSLLPKTEDPTNG